MSNNYEILNFTTKEEYTTEPLSAASINLDNMQNILYSREHPSPISIMIIASVIIICLYYLYSVFVKENFSGKWHVGSQNDIIIMNHNIWNDSVRFHGALSGSGHVNGKAIRISIDGGDIILGAMLKNKIYWVDVQDIWKRERIVE